MERLSLFLLVFFSLTQGCFSQIRLSGGVETGINVSGLPRIQRWSDEIRNSVERIKSVARPLLGVWSRATYKKHFFIGVGVQYNHVGAVEHWRTNGRNMLKQGSYQLDKWDKMMFRRYAFPIIAGYNFNLRKRAASFFLGFKPAHYTKGNYLYQVTVHENGIQTHQVENKVDPFDEGLYRTALKNQKHLLVGMALNATDKLIVMLNYSPAYSQIYFVPQSGWEQPFHTYSKSDYTVTVRYALIDFPSRERKLN